MSERSSFMFQSRLGRSRSSYILPTQSQEVSSKPHMASMLQPTNMPDSSTTPPIPPRSASRPRPRNKLQKKRRPESEERSHLGFLMKDSKDNVEQYSRGTLGGFWVLDQELERNGRTTRNSSWYYQSEPEIEPLTLVTKKGTTTEPVRQLHTRNSSSSSEDSVLSDIWQNSQSSPNSTMNSPVWDSDNTSCSSIYSNDEIERTKTPATDFESLLSSAEVLAEQYRCLLASRASMRTPLPPPVPPKHSARSQSISVSRRPVERRTGPPSAHQNAKSQSINRKPVESRARSQSVGDNVRPPVVPRKPITSHVSSQSISQSTRSHSIQRKPIKTQTSVQSLDEDGNPKPRTLRRVISQHSLRRLTISSHPAFSSGSSSSSADDSGNLSDSSSGRDSFNSSSLSPTTPPPRYTTVSNMDNCDLSRSVHTLTHQLSKALLLRDFCSPSDSMQNLNRNRKSMIQIQSLIEAYEELQEELGMGRVQASEKQMVWEMNGVVGEWLDGLYRKNGA